MSSKEKTFYIFICRTINGEYFAGRKKDIDLLISQFEDKDRDLPFETVAQIKEIGENMGVPLGFGTELIQWFSKTEKPEKRDIDLAVMSIINFLQNGFIY